MEAQRDAGTGHPACQFISQVQRPRAAPLSEGGREASSCVRPLALRQKGGAGCFVKFPMAVHTKEQREFIVRRLAAFETPRAITVAFAIQFPDTRCGEQDVFATDPRVALVDPDLHALFKTECLAYLEQNPLFADQRARLHVMSKQVEDALARNDQATARSIFRQIAEETGVVAGKGGAKAAAAQPAGEPVASITRTIVDPKAPETESA